MIAPLKVRHDTIRSSVCALWQQYLYGDGWRLIEIVMALQVILRGLVILFLGGMTAGYYASFPAADFPIAWGVAGVAIGVARIAGTIINGKWQRSPRLRWTAGVLSMLYMGMHAMVFSQIGLTVIAVNYAFWALMEAAGVIRSSIDIHRKRIASCPVG